MKKIFLCCAAGMSTSMVMNKMKQAAAAQGIAVDIIAVSMDDFDRTLPNYDCCLLGPQVKLKWFTEFGHLNRGDMLTSEQHRCHNEKKKFQR
ncbi:PTS sugar transporter subunit IIB, partial [Klebsiella pneumoniae]|nr:hypothetical protein [Klebsiella pneumoniae]